LYVPTGTAASLSPQVGVYRHLAVVHALTRTSTPGAGEWLAPCYRLTTHLQRLGHNAALLDLGLCTDAEAVAALRALITGLCAQQIPARAAIGPSGVLAQLALLHAPSQEPLACVTPERVEELLRQLPITVLARLRLPAVLALRHDLMAKLYDYGIRSFAQLAQLGEEPLRRQFGGRVGATLAALARGADPLPLQPMPPAERLHVRLRLAVPLTPDRLLLSLPPFTAEVAATLARRGMQAHTLELRLRWERGAVERITRTLPHPLATGRALAETLERMLAQLFQANGDLHALRTVEDLRLIVSDLTPKYPAQHSFWPQRARRMAAAGDVADILARRHGKPLLFQAAHVAPDAVFEQDRSRLTPLTPFAPSASVDADVLEDHAAGVPGVARPTADVAHWTDDGAGDGAGDDSGEAIPHGIHWW